MTYNAARRLLALVLFDKLKRTGKCDLTDVFLYFLGAHTYTVIGNGYRLKCLINSYGDLVGIIGLLRLRKRNKALMLCNGVTRIRHKLS